VRIYYKAGWHVTNLLRYSQLLCGLGSVSAMRSMKELAEVTNGEFEVVWMRLFTA